MIDERIARRLRKSVWAGSEPITVLLSSRQSPTTSCRFNVTAANNRPTFQPATAPARTPPVCRRVFLEALGLAREELLHGK